MKQKELFSDPRWQETLDHAREAWSKRAKETYEKDGDRGSVIMGDGITVQVIPPRCRKLVNVMIIPSRDVSWCQGSLHYEAHINVPLMILRTQYPSVKFAYNYGRMD